MSSQNYKKSSPSGRFGGAFRHRRSRSVPGLNMASMPDLIFTVLFFFMIVTHMRTETPQVKYDLPKGTEISKPANKRANINIYIGKVTQNPQLTTQNPQLTTQYQIQIGDNIVPLQSVGPLVDRFQKGLSDEDIDQMCVTIHADKNTPMGIVNDVKMELRKLGSITVRYSAEDKKNQD